jgi:hypothetical protein
MDPPSLRKKRHRRTAQMAVANWIAGSHCCDAAANACDPIVTTRLALGMIIFLMTQPSSVVCRCRNGGNHSEVNAPIAAIKLIASVYAERFLTRIFAPEYPVAHT